MRRVRPISREEHLAFVAAQPSVSPLQCPSWGEVKAGWRAEGVGWEDGSGALVGAGLVLHRRLPVLGRTLAYLPEGPALPWERVADDVAGWIAPLVAHLRRGGAFAVRMGPPVAAARWEAATLKRAIAAGGARTLADVPPDATTAWVPRLRDGLRTQGWRPPRDEGGFTTGQPRHVFQLPLAGRTLEEVRAGLNQLWRRNVRKAERSGVVVREGDERDLPAFHALYVHTAERDGFTPRGLAYFQGMWRAMRSEDPRRLRLFLAEHDGELLAGATLVTVGDHATYSYGASASHRRELRPSNAVQWRMVEEAHAAGCTVYDLRGISDTLDEADPLFGLVQFKLGTGGHALAYLGEWELPLNGLLHRAVETYLARR
jgi:lipid II:glycine glycyltransferase (peptidoglycan interpeptide bridge formation enzyme)